MLPRAGLGDHPPFAHPPRQQALAERVVDLVRAGVVQVLAFQVDLGPAAFFTQAPGVIQRRRSAHVLPIQFGQLLVKRLVGRRLLVLDDQLVERVGQGFGHVAAAERSKTAGGVGYLRAGLHGASLATG